MKRIYLLNFQTGSLGILFRFQTIHILSFSLPIPSQLFHLFYHATMSCHIKGEKAHPNGFMAQEKPYPVRKPQYFCLSADRYAGNGGNTCKSRSISSLWRAWSKPCPFKRGLLFLCLSFIRRHDPFHGITIRI